MTKQQIKQAVETIDQHGFYCSNFHGLKSTATKAEMMEAYEKDKKNFEVWSNAKDFLG